MFVPNQIHEFPMFWVSMAHGCVTLKHVIKIDL
jgi:hypothetical protein